MSTAPTVFTRQSDLPFGEPDLKLSQVADKISELLQNEFSMPQVRVKRPRVVDSSQYKLDMPLFNESRVFDASHDAGAVASLYEPASQTFTPVADPVGMGQSRNVPIAVDGNASDDVSASSDAAQPMEQETVSFADDLTTFCKVHAGLLYRNLEILLWARVDSDARQEVVDWVFTTHVKRVMSTDGTVITVPAGRDYPFSFDLGCLVEGIDADLLRDAIYRLLERARRGEKITKASICGRTHLRASRAEGNSQNLELAPKSVKSRATQKLKGST